VTAHFDEQGVVTPLHFTWKGGRHRVESTGRRWQDEAGQHMLIMLASGQIYELTYKKGEGRWFIGHVSPSRAAV
jgi:hypothetical protein